MTQKGKAKVLSLAEFKRVDAIASMSKYGKRNRAMLYLSFCLGLRACEIRDLKIEDIFEQNHNFWDIKETVNLKRTKGGKAREIYLSNKKLCAVIVEHMQSQREYMIKKKIPIVFTKPLFLSQKGGFFCSNKIVIILCKMFKDAGISEARSHSGRRTLITNLIDSGNDLKAIADIVGHKNVNTTMGYHQKNPTRLKKILERNIFS